MRGGGGLLEDLRYHVNEQWAGGDSVRQSLFGRTRPIVVADGFVTFLSLKFT